MRILTVDLPCPICELAVTAQVRPARPSYRTLDPPEAAEIQDLRGCPHAEDLFADESFLDAVIEVAERIEEAAIDEAIGETDDG